MQILFLVGLAWGLSRVWEAYGPKLAQARTSGRARAVKRGGTHNTEGAKRRAARQATIGFWSGELWHWFPTARHGFAQGWAEHQDAMLTGERDRAARDADHAHKHAGLRAEIREHRERLTAARRPPSMSEELVRDVDAARRGKAAPLVDWRGRGEATLPAGASAWDFQNAEAGNGPLDGNDKGGAGVAGESDFNYGQTVKTIEEAVTAAEQGIDSEKLGLLAPLSDALGQMLHGDTTACEHIGNAAANAANIERERAVMIENLTAAKEHVVRNYGPQVEAVAASEAGQAPEPAFVNEG